MADRTETSRQAECRPSVEGRADRVPNARIRHRLRGASRFPIHLHLPVTGQPDFAIMMIDYVPRRWLSSSPKSLKLYLNASFATGAFHEQCTVAIPSGSAKLLGPKWLRIGGYFYPRGSMPIDVFWPIRQGSQGRVGAGSGRGAAYRARRMILVMAGYCPGHPQLYTGRRTPSNSRR